MTARRPSRIPAGSWPARMPADLAAGYCGESSAQSFLRRVGRDYPAPAVNQGRRKLWLREDLDRAMGLSGHGGIELQDAAEVL